MNKIGLFIVALLLVSCGNDETVSNTDKGEAVLKIGSDNSMLSSKNSRAETMTVALPDTLTVDFMHTGISGDDGNIVIGKNVDNEYSANCELYTGTYTLNAYNYPSLALALAANNGMGDAWFYATKAGVLINDGSVTSINMNVAISNSLVRVTETGFEESTLYTLTGVFVQTSLNGSVKRSLEYVDLDGTENGWFPAGQDLALKIYFTYKNENYYKIISFDEAIVTAPRTCYDLTIKPSESGFGALTITVDNTLTITTAEVSFDPSNGTPV